MAEKHEIGYQINSSAYKGCLVLIVEDVLLNQQVATAMLKLIGCDVKIAKNGLVALEMIKHEKFDLIFMDCQMPVMDGLEATRRLRIDEATNSHARTPVIAMTARTLEGDEEACLKAGMDDYLSKPLFIQDITEKLRVWLPRQD